MNGARLYARYMGVSIRGQMEYKASFVMLSIGVFLLTFTDFLAILFLFQRFGGIEGWSLAEVGFFYGLISTSFAVADAMAQGFDSFGSMVKAGDFDRLLLRPRSTALQVVGTELVMRRVGRLLQGAVVLSWSCAQLSIAWTAGTVALVILAEVGGICLFLGVLVFQATTAFWTTESLSMFHTLSYGGVQTAQYPLSIYPRWLQRFFTYVVPLAAISYFPGIAILGRDDPLGTGRVFQGLAPLIGVAFLAVSLRVWKLGVRHYTSTGS